MDLSPYLDTLHRDLAAAAAPSGPEVSRVAELLAGALEPAARLSMLEALSDAAAEITTRLGSASVEIRLRGRDAELVVTEVTPDPEPAHQPPPAPVTEGGDVARLTLRLPEQLKDQVERAASAEGVSVNAWLVRAVAAAVAGQAARTGGPASGPGPAPQASPAVWARGRRVTGYTTS